jgi:hypothetical protein
VAASRLSKVCRQHVVAAEGDVAALGKTASSTQTGDGFVPFSTSRRRWSGRFGFRKPQRSNLASCCSPRRSLSSVLVSWGLVRQPNLLTQTVTGRT